MNRVVIYGAPENNPIFIGRTLKLGVSLGVAPSSNVTLTRTVGTSKFTTDVSSLSFTTANWMVPQYFELTAGAITAGLEWDTLTMTRSDGGERTIYVPVIKNNVYTGFTTATWATNLGLWRSWRELRNTGTVQRLHDLMFSGHGDTGNFPQGQPTLTAAGFTGQMHQVLSTNLTNVSSIDKFTHTVRNSFTHYSYLIKSSVTSVHKLLFLTVGHGELANSNELLINNFMAIGWDVWLLAMPLNSINVVDTGVHPSINSTGSTGHNQMYILDSPAYCALGLFFFDKVEALNYAVAHLSYTEYNVTGASGGAYTAATWKAIDTRLSRAVIRPTVMRSSFTIGLDYEAAALRVSVANTSDQCWALNDEIDTLAQLLMAASAGKLAIIYNPYYGTVEWCMHFMITAPRLTALAAATYKLVLNPQSGELDDGFYQSDINLIKTELGL